MNNQNNITVEITKHQELGILINLHLGFAIPICTDCLELEQYDIAVTTGIFIGEIFTPYHCIKCWFTPNKLYNEVFPSQNESYHFERYNRANGHSERMMLCNKHILDLVVNDNEHIYYGYFTPFTDTPCSVCNMEHWTNTLRSELA